MAPSQQTCAFPMHMTHAVGGAFQIRGPRTRVCSLSNVSASFSGGSLALHSLMCEAALDTMMAQQVAS